MYFQNKYDILFFIHRNERLLLGYAHKNPALAVNHIIAEFSAQGYVIIAAAAFVGYTQRRISIA
jgi:hypothetical protein